MKNFLSIILLTILIFSSRSISWGQKFTMATQAFGKGPNSGLAIDVDKEKNIYVIGYHTNSIFFDTFSNNTPASAGRVFIAKFNQSGKAKWVHFIGDEYTNLGYDLVCDKKGFVYATGVFEGTCDFGDSIVSVRGKSSREDVFIAKYDTTGNLIWVRTVGSESGGEYGYEISVDSFSNVYERGIINMDAEFGDTVLKDNKQRNFLCKLNSKGDILWARQFSSVANFVMDVNAMGEIVLAARFAGSPFILDTIKLFAISELLIAKLNTDGIAQWAIDSDKRNPHIYPSEVSLDPFGNIFLNGYFEDSALFGDTMLYCHGKRDIFVTKYNSVGNHQWSRVIGVSPTNKRDQSDDLAADNHGNVFVSGVFNNKVIVRQDTFFPVGPKDVYVAKFDSTGRFIWFKQGGSKGGTSIFNDGDICKGISVDNDSGIYITGSFYAGDTAFFDDQYLLGNRNLDTKRVFVARIRDAKVEIVDTSNPTYLNYYLHKKNAFSVFPNPQHKEDGSFFIHPAGLKNGTYEVCVFNLMGELLKSETIWVNDNASDFKFTLEHPEQGIYFIQLRNENGIFSEKLIMD